jgi:hypothetical protein
VISSTVIFAFALAAFFLAGDYGGGAGIFPQGLAVIMMIASLVIFLRAVFWPGSIPAGIQKMGRMEFQNTAIVVVCTIIYIALIVPLGFATSSILFIAANSCALGYKNHLVVWASAVIFVGIIYFLFVFVFNTPLPREAVVRVFSGSFGG